MKIIRIVLGPIARWIARRQVPDDLAPGDICSVEQGDGRFGIVKVLEVETGLVHVRTFKDTFPRRPYDVNTATLSLGSIDDPDGFGIGHLPLSRAGFGGWIPVRIKSEPVTEDELVGYRIWKESGGGVWN